MDKEVVVHIHSGLLQIFLQCAFDRFVHANSQLERFFFSFLSFFNQMVIISSSLVSVCGTTMFSNAETSCLALFLMFSRHSKYAILGQRSKSDEKRNQSLGQSPTKSWNTGCMFMLSTQVKGMSRVLSLWLFWVGQAYGERKRLLHIKCNHFSYSFWWSCSWICTYLRYCDFLTGFWRFHKDFLDLHC